jgi:hypothetical protein
LDNVNFIQYNYAGATPSEFLMLQIHMPQSNRTRAPINGVRQSDQLEGGAIGDPVTFAAAVVSIITTRVTAPPLLAEPDLIPCFG